MALKCCTFCFHFEAESDGEMKSAGKILMATVKGDVHDIGKNRFCRFAMQQL